MTTFKKVSSGQPLSIRADTFNAFIDAAKAHRDGQNQIQQGPDLSLKSGIVTVRNVSGSDQEFFSVLAIKNIIISPTDNLIEFKHNFAFDVSIFDESTDNPSNIVVLQEPIKAGELGHAMVFGITAIQVNVLDVDHEFVTLPDNDVTLESSSGGVARIVYKEPGLGPVWSVITFPTAAPSHRMFKVVSVEIDYLICHTWDGVTEGTDPIEVALPYMLQRTPWDGNTRDGLPITYITNIHRVLDLGGPGQQEQIIHDTYEVGDIIFGVKDITGGTDVTNNLGDPVTWLDLNVDARRWGFFHPGAPI